MTKTTREKYVSAAIDAAIAMEKNPNDNNTQKKLRTRFKKLDPYFDNRINIKKYNPPSDFITAYAEKKSKHKKYTFYPYGNIGQMYVRREKRREAMAKGGANAERYSRQAATTIQAFGRGRRVRHLQKKKKNAATKIQEYGKRMYLKKRKNSLVKKTKPYADRLLGTIKMRRARATAQKLRNQQIRNEYRKETEKQHPKRKYNSDILAKPITGVRYLGDVGGIFSTNQGRTIIPIELMTNGEMMKYRVIHPQTGKTIHEPEYANRLTHGKRNYYSTHFSIPTQISRWGGAHKTSYKHPHGQQPLQTKPVEDHKYLKHIGKNNKPVRNPMLRAVGNNRQGLLHIVNSLRDEQERKNIATIRERLRTQRSRVSPNTIGKLKKKGIIKQ